MANVKMVCRRRGTDPELIQKLQRTLLIRHRFLWDAQNRPHMKDLKRHQRRLRWDCKPRPLYSERCLSGFRGQPRAHVVDLTKSSYLEKVPISDGFRHLLIANKVLDLGVRSNEYAFPEFGIKPKLPGSSIQHLTSDPTRCVVTRRKA